MRPVSGPLQALVGQLKGLDGRIAFFGVKVGSVVLAGPSPYEVPTRHLFAFAVEQDDRAVLALQFALDRLAVPFIEAAVVGDTPLKRDVAVLGQAGKLAHGSVLASLTVLDHVNR